jgi:hypothetical protein
MAVFTTTELKLDRRFDPVKCRHFMNDVVTVLHCHHFTTLYCQLADDAELVDGKKLLANAAEESFGPILKEYFRTHEVSDVSDRVAIAEEYYGALGMGLMKVVGLGPNAGTVELLRSHVDEGWRKKWGERDEPVNFITQGFVAGLFAAANDLPLGSFQVTEVQSIVAGAETSVFRAVRP